MDIAPITVDEESNTGIWEVVLKYGKPEPLVDDEVFTFETGGGSQHITNSISTIKAYGAPGVPASKDDNGNAVNVDSEGKVNGIEIVTPVFNFTITKRLDGNDVTSEYKRNVAKLTGKVNNASFKGYEAGEVLFLGASGQSFKDPDKIENGFAKEYWDITFSFAVSYNEQNRTIGKITGIDKKGWEYLWVKYGMGMVTHGLTAKPVAVYIEQIYLYGAFSDLLIN